MFWVHNLGILLRIFFNMQITTNKAVYLKIILIKMAKISLDQEKLTLVKKLAPRLTVLAGLMDAIAFHRDFDGSKILRFGRKFIILIEINLRKIIIRENLAFK